MENALPSSSLLSELNSSESNFTSTSLDVSPVSITSSPSFALLPTQEQQQVHSMLYHAQRMTSTLSSLIQAQSNTTASSVTLAQQKQFFEFQNQINQTMSTLVKANALGLLSSHVHHRHVQQKLRFNEGLLQKMHHDTVRLESNLKQVQIDLTQTQCENEQLKHHLTALRKTCEDAIRHYRLESQRQNEILKKQESAIQNLLSTKSSSNIIGYIGIAFLLWLIPDRGWPKGVSKSFFFKCLAATYVLLHTRFSVPWILRWLSKRMWQKSFEA